MGGWRAPISIVVAAVTLASSSASSAPRAQSPSTRHVIYLHGRIVQAEQDPRPRHPEFGYYELEKILDALRARGFTVTGEIRPKGASVTDAADRVARQIRDLAASDVAAGDISVLGASMGASIALLASARLQNPQVRVAVLGACLSENVDALLREEGRSPVGRLLSIREASDTLTGECRPWGNRVQPGLEPREIVIHTGLSHGFLYRPLPEWLNPVTEFVGGR